MLIDGEEVLPSIEDAIRDARRHVHIAGWSITPEFELTRGADPAVVGDLLADVARGVDLRVLLWAGAPVRRHPPRPARRPVRPRRFMTGSRVKVALDARERPGHCHHEKIVVVDG